VHGLNIIYWGYRGLDRMVVGFITICAIIAYHQPSSWPGVLDTTWCD